ncbi:class II aldolase/adducin family protein, partial [Klebsiella pneumoniae]|uniref:class II aldolase/adducin family protein n=1 Tax=Klebsiella pneumoniae TaxID=573 RepID=UPI0035B66EFA
ERLAQLVTTCHWIGAKGWAPATGGNMSVRQDDTWCWLSESGRGRAAESRSAAGAFAHNRQSAPPGRQYPGHYRRWRSEQYRD